MPHQAEGSGCRNATLILPALVLFLYPLEVFLIVAWMWLMATIVLSIITAAALAVRSLILPYTHPELYRLVRCQRRRARVTPVQRLRSGSRPYW